MTCAQRPVAFVTGSTRGIGKACAYQLAQSGFNVAINGATPKKAVHGKK